MGEKRTNANERKKKTAHVRYTYIKIYACMLFRATAVETCTVIDFLLQ